MHSFDRTRYRWIVVAILHCDRPNYCPTPANYRQTVSPSQSFSPCDRHPLPQCKTLSLRRESAQRSAYLHPSQKLKRLARPSRTMRRYDLGFLWGLWLVVAVQNMIRNSPQGMPSAERSFIASCPTQAAGVIA
jgi:hypothetical protein